MDQKLLAYSSFISHIGYILETFSKNKEIWFVFDRYNVPSSLKEDMPKKEVNRQESGV